MLRISGRILLGNALKKPIISPRLLHVTPVLDKIVSFKLADIGEGITQVVVKEWLVKEGDVVPEFEPIVEVQSDKASVTISSRFDGTVKKLHYNVDEIAKVGAPLVDFEVADEEGGDEATVVPPTPEKSTSTSVQTTTGEKIDKPVENVQDRAKPLATPAVRRIAMEHKVDLSKVTATGKNGRVLKGDVLEFLNLIPEGTQKPHPTLLKPAEAPVYDRVEPVKGITLAMVKTMTEALRIPHFCYCDEVEMTKLMSVRETLKAEALESGVKLTYMPFIIKAASQALKKYPILNSTFDEPNMRIIYKGAHNISVAIASPQGLVVPNIKNVQSKSILEIAQDLKVLQEKGQKGSLSINDFSNGTFSISNIGMVGGTYTKPVIMPPQVAIGALGQIRALPRFGPNDAIVKANIMEVSWSADHRIIDGVTMAQFSNLWKKYLENPNFFLLSN